MRCNRFLIDELLDVESIQNEFQARMALSSPLKAYEPTCTEEELDNIVNEEKCALCNLQGDLLCCDGCPSSYHRQCVGISLQREFREEEKWLCSECKIVDPSRVGSLYGGRKCGLDWFSLKDIGCAVDMSMLEDDKMDIFGSVEFLVVHGFVFVRNAETKANINMTKLLASGESISKEAKTKICVGDSGAVTPLPLDGSDLFRLLQRLGPRVCERWPFSQIPFKPSASGKDDNIYSTAASAYNLFVSQNEYWEAPVPLFVTSHAGKKNDNLLRQGRLLLPQESCLENLSLSTSNDGFICELIQSYGNDHTSMYSIRAYMMTLERTLFRSSLLHEQWGLRNRLLQPELWGQMVSLCTNFESLAMLLLRLVDDTHPRAFRDEWGMVPGIAQEDFTRFDKENRIYADLPREWKSCEEKKRRDWEKSLASDVLSLLAKESTSKIQKSRRKKNKSSDNKQTSEREVRQEVTSAPLNTQIPVDDRKNRRRGRESLTRNAVKVNYVKPLKDLEGEDVDVIRDAMLYRLETGVDADFDEEGHWPVCGRRLFAPSGSMPTPTIKWLARNGGVKRAPGVFYTDKFEIGLPSVNMIWRTRLSSCKSFADLTYCIEFLDSYLNKAAMLSCEKLSSRTGLKEHIQKTVTTSRYDQELGAVEHFVIHKNKWRGKWRYVMHQTAMSSNVSNLSSVLLQ